MQTFLPLPNLKQSVECLDWRRLGKQRVEALMILRMLAGKKSRWENHPAVIMWRGYEDCLTIYYNLCVQEWIKRGYKNTMVRCAYPPNTRIRYPRWFGGTVHANHRWALLHKAALRSRFEGLDDELHWYGQFKWNEVPIREEVIAGRKFEHYIWPR